MPFNRTARHGIPSVDLSAHRTCCIRFLHWTLTLTNLYSNSNLVLFALLQPILWQEFLIVLIQLLKYLNHDGCVTNKIMLYFLKIS